MCSVCLCVNEVTWSLGWAKGTWKILERKASVSTKTPSPGIMVPKLYPFQKAARGGLSLPMKAPTPDPVESLPALSAHTGFLLLF